MKGLGIGERSDSNGVGILPTGWRALGDLGRTRPAPESVNLLSPETFASKVRHRSQVGADDAVLLFPASAWRPGHDAQDSGRSRGGPPGGPDSRSTDAM